MASAAVAQPQAAAAPPKSPPKLKNDKGKLTELHGEPPMIIKRNENGYLTRGRMLGEGGFARVYAATDSITGSQKAVKVISKEQLKSTKTKSKVSPIIMSLVVRSTILVLNLYLPCPSNWLHFSLLQLFAEIKLHQVMDHPNIIKFECCFEDTSCVYMQLELCAHGVSSGYTPPFSLGPPSIVSQRHATNIVALISPILVQSMLDLLRRRKRFTEPETRYYLTQLIGAAQYMHQNSVIHRDLKLGNLMLDADMNLKVGDFGLAALVKFPGERKKWVHPSADEHAIDLNLSLHLGRSAEHQTISHLKFYSTSLLDTVSKLISGP